MTWLTIAAAVATFFLVQPRDQPAAEEFFYESATIPCEVTTREPLTPQEILQSVCEEAPTGTPVFPDKNIATSLLASLFLHADLVHLLGNMWMLFIFGNNVEDAFGKVGFALFYVTAGLLASGVHILGQPDSTIPVIGASGAIAGVMGAYLVLFPTARVVSVFPIFFFIPVAVPAVLFLGLWFLGQFAIAGESTNVAWQAHVGGFVVGIVAALFLRRTLLRRIQQHRRSLRLPV